MEEGDHFLCVGLVCVDNIYEVDSFPQEDTDKRCLSQWKQRGGNASNNCTILGILGGRPYFFGTIADSLEQKFIEEDFREFEVNCTPSVVVRGSECPNSCVIISLATGSRTIIHSNKNLKEPSLEDFLQIDFNQFKWIHFEGRNISVTKEMIRHVRKLNETRSKPITVSVEIEKAKDGMEELIALGDYVFFSKEYAQFRGWNSAKDALEQLSKQLKEGVTAVCPWGDQGASAVVAPRGPILSSPAFSPERVVDTLGAGDTFIGSTIFALSSGQTLEQSLRFGCKIAGFKIQFRGWSEFRTKIRELDWKKDLLRKGT